MKLRREVALFAQLMEKQLVANDHLPGWKGEEPMYFWSLVEAKVHKFLVSFNTPTGEFDIKEVGLKAADVANYVMMIADNCRVLEKVQEDLDEEKRLAEEAKKPEGWSVEYSSCYIRLSKGPYELSVGKYSGVVTLFAPTISSTGMSIMTGVATGAISDRASYEDLIKEAIAWFNTLEDYK